MNCSGGLGLDANKMFATEFMYHITNMRSDAFLQSLRSGELDDTSTVVYCGAVRPFF
jgi:hypothetical protein